MPVPIRALASEALACDSSGLFERFTPSAREVVVLAQEEARGLQHNYIGTEHELLGLLGEEDGVVAQVLGSLGVTVEQVREQVLRIVWPGEEVGARQIPFTPRAKKVLELALHEAINRSTAGVRALVLSTSCSGCCARTRMSRCGFCLDAAQT